MTNNSEVSPTVSIAAGLIALGSIAQGGWAYLFPSSFYDDFPVPGLAWVSTLGPFNEHLTTDVGAALVGLGIATWLARRSRAGIQATMAAFGVFGTAHLVFHLRHLEPFGAVSAIAQVVSLSVLVVVPAWLLVAVRGGAR